MTSHNQHEVKYGRGDDSDLVSLRFSSATLAVCIYPSRLRLRLQEHRELRTRQDCFSLLQCLNFLVASGLANFKVLDNEITTSVEFGFVIAQLLKFQKHRFTVILSLHQIS